MERHDVTDWRSRSQLLVDPSLCRTACTFLRPLQWLQEGRRVEWNIQKSDLQDIPDSCTPEFMLLFLL